ncbi:MAG: hypothetical protein RLZZ241_873 [Bacteroidota bacterium]|jgi:tetratricopeptide (TPR) repeat protein
MYRLALLLIVFATTTLVAQEEFFAKQYFEEGAFEKSVVLYEKLHQANPGRSDFADKLVACYQQLEQYDKAINFLNRRLNSKTVFPTNYIDMGYTYLLKGEDSTAVTWYRKALEAVQINPNTGYSIGFTFQRYTLLDYALQAYQLAMDRNVDLDFSLQMAQIFGEQGKIPEMFEAYLDLISRRPAIQGNILRAIEAYVGDNPMESNNQHLKRMLLLRAQRSPDPMWNELLSWLLVRQGQFSPALIQEKAIYKRAPEAGLQRISGLGNLAEESGEWDIADKAYGFVVSESPNRNIQLMARLRQIGIAEKQAKPNLEKIQQAYLSLMESYPYAAENLPLFLAYADFLAFKNQAPEAGIAILKEALQLPLSNYAQGRLKLKLGDILVFDGKYNEGLIHFTQVQRQLKNDVMGQEARFKVAQTSFYKGDFDWAITQLKVLRESTTQLIANDAMQLSLIISDNTLEDSTQTALKLYAKADLLAYQNKTASAIETLEMILKNHKGESIEDEALLRHGQLMAANGNTTEALLSFRKIIEFFGGDILADDAHYAMAELYKNQLQDTEAAMEHYQSILYEFQDSYFFPEARKKFRALRGDTLN